MLTLSELNKVAHALEKLRRHETKWTAEDKAAHNEAVKILNVAAAEQDHLTDDRIIKLYYAGVPLCYVAGKYGKEYKDLHTLVHRMRKKGVNLPPRHGASRNTSKTFLTERRNKMIAEFEKNPIHICARCLSTIE